MSRQELTLGSANDQELIQNFLTMVIQSRSALLLEFNTTMNGIKGFANSYPVPEEMETTATIGKSIKRFVVQP